LKNSLHELRSREGLEGALKYLKNDKAAGADYIAAELLKNDGPNLADALHEVIRGGLGSKGLCGIPYKKFFKIPKKPLFVTFCRGDYKSLAAIAALPQWPVRPWK
jgi:hypothetical protein